jgi:hypothetical protein
MVVFSDAFDSCRSHYVGSFYLLLLRSSSLTNSQRRKQVIPWRTFTISFFAQIGQRYVYWQWSRSHLSLICFILLCQQVLPSTSISSKVYETNCSYSILLLREGVDYRIHEILPTTGGVSEAAPGLNFITELSARLRNIVALVLDILVLFRIIFLTRNPDAKILGSLWTLFCVLIYCAPSNAIGGAGKQLSIKEILACILTHN